ncbi:MAG: hypothetical protein P4L84_10710 [Isosphaeraceae bacterium]|jgi:hypothetical protein|nr:hypothetical protein [Isosphaeraceae bacterium]
MWQTHYDLVLLRMRELEAEAETRRRWQLEDRWNGQASAPVGGPSRARSGAARAARLVSRAADQFAVWLGGGVPVEPRPDRSLRGA